MQIGKQMNLSEFRRRPACEVRIGGVTIGGKHPVAVQSMTNTDTNDTAASVAQIERIDRAGGHIVRLTAQGRREGENLGNIVRQLIFDGRGRRHPFRPRGRGRRREVRR